jgi:mono/diheme cytochrome c family protein
MSSRVTAPGWIGALSSIVIAGSAGCEPDLGTCDMQAATSVVYRADADGTPFYAGQAIVQDSCSGYCHAASAVGDLRNGAPHGLNFDVAPLTAQSPAGSDGVLRDGIAKVRDEAADMYGQIEDGDMPPGKVGMRTVPIYKVVPSAEHPDGKANLPTISEAAGKATVRNWLACGAPVISAVQGAPLATAVSTIDKSQVVAAMPTTPSGTGFADIYTGILMASCASCHQPGGPFQALDLSSQTAAYTNLVGKDASTAGLCGGKGKYVVPGDCENSILYQKLQPSPKCGTQMPMGGNPLSAAAIKSVCDWIKAGANM